MSYFYIALTVLFTVYGQLVLKWRVGLNGDAPEAFGLKLLFVLRLLCDPYIMSGFFAAFLAALCWMAAIVKLPLSTAYPFTGLVFVLLMIFGVTFFHEPLNWQKITGTGLVVLGIIVVSQG